MREIINISLPKTLTKIVKESVKENGYASTSEFFRALLRGFIAEQELYADIMKSERQFNAGKGKKLKSLKNLR